MIWVLFLLFLATVQSAPPQVKWFDQAIDHFNQQQTPNLWKQRYLIWDSVWNGSGPMFFYTGNEGDITSFWDNSQIIIEKAKEFRALVSQTKTSKKK